jgi:hypothetical protein
MIFAINQKIRPSVRRILVLSASSLSLSLMRIIAESPTAIREFVINIQFE